MSKQQDGRDLQGILENFKSLDNVKRLFSELNYDITRGKVSRKNWGDAAKDALIEDPQIIANHGDFNIIYCKLNHSRLPITLQRPVISKLLTEFPYSLFVFSNDNESLWHLVNVKVVSKDQDADENKDPKKRRVFRRIAIGQTTRLRTAIERILLLDLAQIEPELFGIAPLTIQAQHDKAFDVEAVTREFYGAYCGIFTTFWKNLEKQSKDRKWAHDYALQFLNRVMFLYFVQRKGWLGEDLEFLESYFKSYRKAEQKANSFFKNWLKVLFFEAFNNQKTLLKTPERAYLPEDIKKILWNAPYLNGGLFKESKLDTQYEFEISDKQFESIFNFFQRYNFTISEDSPLDQEVAVDPEMIGKVYEGLVNVSDNIDERGEAGIFYTPRTEIDLMCRLSVVDNLSNHIGQEQTPLLYDFVFAMEKEEKEEADKAISEEKLGSQIYDKLRNITVLDPACGSGSFLVGMLNVLDDLIVRAANQCSKPNGNSYERKKNIIGQSLYGVDVMDWAVHVAELRLWLALIVDAEFTKEELTIRKEPLLPHFSFKIRHGDSLVQDIGGIDMAHRRGGISGLDKATKSELTQLKNEKSKFFNNEKSCKYKTPDDIEQQEVLVFRKLLEGRAKTIENQAKELMRLQEERKVHKQLNLLTGEAEAQAKQTTLEQEKREKQIEELMLEKQGLEQTARQIRDKTKVPFIWDISFAEIFSGEKHGFDVVIGNPPYVRQESIADPRLDKENITTENKKQYKARLARSVYKEYSSYFDYNEADEKATKKLDAKSDLYIYFYFNGLSLLNEKGSFCFITSNSWLDVGYGKDLQEFLLRRCHVKYIIDNKSKRSFKDADVNTVIVLLGSPTKNKIKDSVSLEKTAKFIMLHIPFEEVLEPVIFREFYEIRTRVSAKEYRIFPIQQLKLLEDGGELDTEEGLEKKETKSADFLAKSAKYIGNKWGGKYLRAPDIYWTVIEKGKDKLVKLCEIADVKRGITTGCNDFFYLTNAQAKQWKIEKDFLRPAVLKTEELEFIDCRKIETRGQFFCCNKSKNFLKKTYALKYIEWGEKQSIQIKQGKNKGKTIKGFNKIETVKNRKFWYSLGNREVAPLWWIIAHNERNISFINDKIITGDNFFEIRPKINIYDLSLSLNSTLTNLFRDLLGRSNFGGGVLKTQKPDLNKFLVLNYSFGERSMQIVNKIGKRQIFSIFQESGIDPQSEVPIEHQEPTPLPDRKELDDMIFDAIGLTQEERKDVYRAVCRLVWDRVSKAKSLK